jgi:hypothetical protein
MCILELFKKHVSKLFALILIFSNLNSFGQNIEGIVLNKKNNAPLKNVNVYLKKTDDGTSTNEKGSFEIKVKSIGKKSDSIFFSILGYSTKGITLSELQHNNYVVYLSENIEKLKEVTVRSNAKLNSKINYKKLSSLKGGLHSFGSSLIDGNIYIIGGDASYLEDSAKKIQHDYANLDFDDYLKKLRINPSWEGYKDKLQIYNIDSEIWTTSELKFRKRAYHNLNFHKNTIYVSGGKRLSANRKFEYLDDIIEVFDLKSQTIKIDNTNPHQAINSASFTYHNNIIIMGGSVKLKSNGDKQFTNTSHIYNLESGLWYQLKDMPEAKEVNGVLIKNKIYLIGGFNNKPLKAIESYDLTTGKWEKEAELFSAIADPALTVHYNSIYIYEDGKIYTYNTDTKELNEYLIDLPYKSSELYFFNNKLLLLGGFKENEFSKTPSSNLYSIDINEFDKTKVYKSKLY